MRKIFYINLIYFKATFRMLHISQGNRLHPAPDMDFQPARQLLDGCAMTPQPSSSQHQRPLLRKRSGSAAAILQQQARLACLGAAG